MLAIVEAYQSGLLHAKHWQSNILAGVIVGVVALPLAMAFAIASGVTPQQGLYTAIIAALFVGVFGGSRVQIAGPTGAFVVILADITAKYGVEGLQIATLLAGFFLILMGLMKFGHIMKYIPDSVIVGFTAGIGFIIFMGEWKDFFGLTLASAAHQSFYEKLVTYVSALPSMQFVTAGLSCLSIFLILITPKFVKRVPGPLVAMLVITGLQVYFQFENVATLGSTFGGIPSLLPSFQVPAMSLEQLMELMGPAITIALLGAIESLLSATAADNMLGTRHHSNQELIGQGLANIVAPLFGGFAATGAIARTATNVKNGGTSPIAAIAHSAFLISVIVLLAPLAAYIPLCSLAAILFVVAYNMSDVPRFYQILTKERGTDVAVLLITFVLTIFTNLIFGVIAGVALSMLLRTLPLNTPSV